MARYEEMDKLLQGVRQHLDMGREAPGPEPQETPGPVAEPPVSPIPTVRNQTYALAAAHLTSLLHDVEQLREHLRPMSLTKLTQQQRDDLLSLLRQLLEEIRLTQAALEGRESVEL